MGSQHRQPPGCARPRRAHGSGRDRRVDRAPRRRCPRRRAGTWRSVFVQARARRASEPRPAHACDGDRARDRARTVRLRRAARRGSDARLVAAFEPLALRAHNERLRRGRRRRHRRAGDGLDAERLAHAARRAQGRGHRAPRPARARSVARRGAGARERRRTRPAARRHGDAERRRRVALAGGRLDRAGEACRSARLASPGTHTDGRDAGLPVPKPGRRDAA